MKKNLLTASMLIILTGFAKCPSNSSDTSLFKNKWSLLKIYMETGTKVLKSNTAYIKFDQLEKSVAGNGGCNGFTGTITVSADKLSLSQFTVAEMYCEDVQETENAFLRYLQLVNRFEINDKSLFMYRNKELILEFESK